MLTQDPMQLGAIGIFAFMVIREVLVQTSAHRVRKQNGGQEPIEALLIKHTQLEERILAELLTKQRDLHKWHAPNETGSQTWKDTGPVLQSIKGTHVRLDRLCDVIDKLIQSKVKHNDE